MDAARQLLLATIALLGLLFVRAGRAVAKWYRANRVLSALPGPPKHWILGNVELLTRPENNVTWYMDLGRQHGDLFHVRALHQQVVVISRPEWIAKVFGRELSLSKPDQYWVATKLTSGTGKGNLVSLRTDDPLWRVVRKGVAPAFSTKNLRGAFEAVNTYSMQMVELLRQAGPDSPQDLSPIVIRETLDVIARWGFKTDLGVLQDKGRLMEPGISLPTALRVSNHEGVKLFYNPLRAYMVWDKEVRDAQPHYRALYRFYSRLLASCREAHDPDDASDESLAACLLRLRDPITGKPLPDDVLASQLGVLFWAGHDTTGLTIAYTLYLLSQHPEAEAKLVAELDAVGLLATPTKPEPRALEYDDLTKRLPYLQAVVKESMRMLPVAPATARVSDQDVMLGEHTIPAGTLLLCDVLNMHAFHFEDGDSFRPERWIENPGAAVATKPPPPPAQAAAAAPASTGANRSTVGRGSGGGAAVRRFVPFADGPRDCVGQNLATVTVPATVAQLVRHFKLVLDPLYPHGTVRNSGLIMTPLHGMPMYPIPRGV